MSLVLITGATGFIGAQVALRTLEAGFNVRLVVRREDQADKLRRIFSEHQDKITFVVVPDITMPGGFDQPPQGVEYVMHVASPIPGSGTTDHLTPAVKGTVSVLQSAMKAPSIRKVVITASRFSLIPIGPIPDGAVVRVSCQRSEMEKYHASKIAAHKAVIDFVAANNPAFGIATIHPIYVFGRSLVQETADQLNGTNRLLFLSLISGTKFDGQFIGVHVDDVAIAHVRALTRSGSTVKGVQPYLVSCRRHSWREVYDFVKRRYPNVPIKLDPADSTDYMVDTTRAERELGMEFRQMEEQVADVMDQQLELRG